MRRLLKILLILFLPNACCCLLSGAPPVKLWMNLLFGWLAFVKDTAPRVTVNPAAVATFVVTLLLVTLGAHLFASWLRRSMRPGSRPWELGWTLAAVALFVLAFVAGIAAVGVFHQAAWLATAPEPVIEEQGGGRKRRNFTMAALAFRTIGDAQTRFREGDKEKDGVCDFGTLEELRAADLVDPILGAGTKQGYTFEVAPSPVSPESLWFGVASPAHPVVADYYLFTNQSGTIFYTTTQIAFDRVTCEPPAGLTVWSTAVTSSR